MREIQRQFLPRKMLLSRRTRFMILWFPTNRFRGNSHSTVLMLVFNYPFQCFMPNRFWGMKPWKPPECSVWGQRSPINFGSRVIVRGFLRFLFQLSPNFLRSHLRSSRYFVDLLEEYVQKTGVREPAWLGTHENFYATVSGACKLRKYRQVAIKKERLLFYLLLA